MRRAVLLLGSLLAAVEPIEGAAPERMSGRSAHQSVQKATRSFFKRFTRAERSDSRQETSREPLPEPAAQDEAVPEQDLARDPDSILVPSRDAYAPAGDADSNVSEPQAGASHVDLQIQSVENRLKLEEQRLQQQLAQYGRLRDAALKKEDADALKRIEQLEGQTIQAYQRRVDQIVATVKSDQTVTPPATPAQRPAAGPSRTARRLPTKPQNAGTHNKSQRSRSKMRFPFGL